MCHPPVQVFHDRGNPSAPTPLRLALCAGCKPFCEEGDAGVAGVGRAGGDGGRSGARAVLAGGVLAGACLEAGAAPGGQQAGQGGPSDGPGQVSGPAGQDAGGGGDQVAGGVQEDGEADAVHVQAGHGGGGVGGGADQCLVGGEQGPGFLVDAVQGARAQDAAVEHGGFDGVVGGLGLPPLVVEIYQLGGGVAGVAGQAGDQPPLPGAGGAISQGDGDLGLDDADLDQGRED